MGKRNDARLASELAKAMYDPQYQEMELNVEKIKKSKVLSREKQSLLDEESEHNRNDHRRKLKEKLMLQKFTDTHNSDMKHHTFQTEYDNRDAEHLNQRNTSQQFARHSKENAELELQVKISKDNLQFDLQNRQRMLFLKKE